MKRLFGLILIAILLAGCKSDPPVCDPFFGRTTIPPPPTGAVAGCADPCYQPPPLIATPPAATGCSPPTVQLPSAATSASTPPAIQMPFGPQGTTAQPLMNQASPQPAAPGFGPMAPRPSSTMPSSAPPPRYSTPPASPAATLGPSPSGNPVAAPGTNPYAPNPSGSPATSPGTNPYAPPGGYNYRGTSTQGSIFLPTRSASPTVTNVAISRGSAINDDRTPRPLDSTATDGSFAGRKPIVGTVPPRSRYDSSGVAVDIADLPAAP